MLDFNIETTKNLLAFSGGIDSSALFYLLVEKNIPFDIAIVDYNMRPQSKKEVAYAKMLAMHFKKKCHIKSIKLKGNANFEKKARDARYDFFEELIEDYKYETLLTAHQLNDKLEWFLMQLSKGAGLIELMGLEKVHKKENYIIRRPLLETSKEELVQYLEQNQFNYFIDETNLLKIYKRNKFRHTITDQFIQEYKKGVIKSFEYLQEDISALDINYTPIYSNKELNIYEKCINVNTNIRIIDRDLKKRGFLLSNKQRKEILDKKELVVSHKISVCIMEDKIWIAPYSKVVMDKKAKESYRLKRIPVLIRAYIFQENINI